MIEGEKLVDKVKALKVKYCSYWRETPEGDTFQAWFNDIMCERELPLAFSEGDVMKLKRRNK